MTYLAVIVGGDMTIYGGIIVPYDTICHLPCVKQSKLEKYMALPNRGEKLL